MLLSPARTLPTGDGWLYEVKWDGFRCIAVKTAKNVHLWSRNRKRLTARFPMIAKEFQDLSAESFILDGEIVCLEPDGTPSFQKLQNALTEPESGQCFFYAFDLLQLNGASFLKRPLWQRKQELAKVLVGSPHLRVSHNLDGQPDQIVECVRELKLEGIVAKRADSVYRSGLRSSMWRKFKLYQAAEVVVGGFVSNPESEGVDALLVGVQDGSSLRYCAKVPLHLGGIESQVISGLLATVLGRSSPFRHVPQKRDGDTWSVGLTKVEKDRSSWLKPVVKAKVEFIERTDAGYLRHCRFQRFVA